MRVDGCELSLLSFEETRIESNPISESLHLHGPSRQCSHSMSATPQALEVVQAVYAAFGRGTFPRYSTSSLTTSNGSSVARRAGPIQGHFERRKPSPNGSRAFPRSRRSRFSSRGSSISAGDSVTVLGWERSRARPSGKVFETEWVHFFTAHDGRITRHWGMYDTEVSAAARA